VSALLACALWLLWAAPPLAAQLVTPGDEPFFETYSHSDPITKWPLKKALRKIPELRGLEPATDQSQLPEILRRVSENLQKFVTNFVNITALETIDETENWPFQRASDHIVQKFRYLVLGRQEGEALTLIEYRTDLHGGEEHRQRLIAPFLMTTGFASMPLFFGPLQQPWSDFRLLGQQTIRGDRTEAVAFAEHVDPEGVMGRFSLGKASIPILLQGVAWIRSSDFQILKMRTDLLAALPPVAQVTTVAFFASTQFQDELRAFWLPHEVEVAVDVNRFKVRNRHRYSDYQLFRVKSVIKPDSPAAQQGWGPASTGGTNTSEKNKFTSALWLGFMHLCACRPCSAQTGDSAPIRVQSNVVLVPTYVFDKSRLDGPPSQSELRCVEALGQTFDKLLWTEPYLPEGCDEAEVHGLVAKDFHIFEDGVEQNIRSVTVEADAVVPVRDNVGQHKDFSRATVGKWSTADLPRGSRPGGRNYYYVVAYTPAKPKGGGCHKVKVRVDRPDLFVSNRSEYCSDQSPADLLIGTSFGKRLESDLSSADSGNIGLALQYGLFYTDADHARLDIALEFPWNSLQRQWGKDFRLYATIGVLGMVYRKDGSVAMRFGDFACCSSDAPVFVAAPDGTGPSLSMLHSLVSSEYSSSITEVLNSLSLLDVIYIPDRYEAQVGLPPGEYDLRVVLSDDTKFGRAEIPLTVEKYDGKELALSSVVLCKRFRDASAAAQEAAAANLAPKYVPLVSKGIEVTPAGDTRWKAGETLIPYFEVYEPLLVGEPATAVEAHLRILEAGTGVVKQDFASVSAGTYERAGSAVIPIARKIPIDRLPKGAYRLEVQASDSAGRSTAWRAADFKVE
jgi:hypothetical protein